MNVLRTSCWVLATIALAANARADSLGDTFARGNQAFARGDYAAAVEEYETLVQAGVDDPDVSFNLASAYGAAGRYGQAIRHFEHALSLAPRDAAARTGLAAARDALGRRQALETGEAVVANRPPLIEALFSPFTASALAIVLLLSAALASTFGFGLLYARSEATRLASGIGAALGSALLLFTSLGLYVKTYAGEDGVRAIVVSERAPLRDGPDERARLAAEVPEGTQVHILAREASYVHVRAGKGREGYMRAIDVGEI